MLKVAAVRRRAYAELFGAITRIGDAVGGHRVRAQKFRQAGVVQTVEVLHLFEKRRHGVRVETGVREDLHADAIGFLFEAARVVDSLLGDGGTGQRDCRFAPLVAGTRQEYAREYGRHGWQSGAL
jgi:hypothetical protein